MEIRGRARGLVGVKRCVACGRAVDDDSGMVEHGACPWCGGDLAPDPAGARTLADAVQVMWTVDPSLPYDAHAATIDLRDLCPDLPASVSRDMRVADEVGALALLRDGKDPGARKALDDGAHWHEGSVESFMAAYWCLCGPAAPPTTATVAFDPNGGLGGAPGPVECRVGERVKLPGAGGLRRPGHRFAGWSREESGAGALAPGSAIVAKGDLTLHAAWERVATPPPPPPPPPATATVAFDANGGTGKVPGLVSCRVGGEVVLPGPGGLRRRGHRFAGWSREASGGGALAPGSAIVAKGDVTLHASWEKATRPRWPWALAAALAAVALIAGLAFCGAITSASVPVRNELADYSWVELKSLSSRIAAAWSDAEGLAIAKEYNLVDGDGRLRGDEKPVTLKDGTKTSVRVAGFRHDELAFFRKPGITFEFADVPAVHSMNEKSANAGGWEASGMRAWLNSEFLKLLPDDLCACVEPARKRTNNRGEVEEGDTSCVTETADSLWLLSVSEVYGSPSESKWVATYDAEGTQYQLYADQGVTTQGYGFCKKSGADSRWWLRSPSDSFVHSFRNVGDGGYWSSKGADGVRGVSPGFCF